MMAGFILTAAATIQCTHGGSATAIASNFAVMVDNSPVLVESDTHVVAGCPFNVSGSPMPCVTIAWSAGALQVQVNGTPALVQSSIGLCKNAAGAPQGMAIVANTQTKVSAT